MSNKLNFEQLAKQFLQGEFTPGSPSPQELVSGLLRTISLLKRQTSELCLAIALNLDKVKQGNQQAYQNIVDAYFEDVDAYFEDLPPPPPLTEEETKWALEVARKISEKK